MDFTTFFICLFLLCVSYLILGMRTSDQTTSQDAYLLSSRTIGPVALGLSILATQLGGGTLMGAAQEAYYHGISVIFYPLGATLGLFALAMGLGKKWYQLNLCTLSELFERTYSSPKLRKFSALLSIFSLFLLLVGQGIAARHFLVSIGIDSPVVFWGFWVCLITYTVAGGLSAVVQTDVLQTLFILASLVLALVSITWPSSHTPQESFSLFKAVSESNMDLSHVSWSNWLLLPFLFMLIEQDMGQRCFAAKSEKAVVQASFFAASILFLATVFPIYVGIRAQATGLAITEKGSILIDAISTWSSPHISAIFSCAILMAVISTADSLLCSITSNISYDFPLKRYSLSEKQKVRLAQGATLLIGLLAMALSSYFDSVLSTLMLAYELSVCLLLVPLLAATFTKKLPEKAATFSIIAAFIGYLLHFAMPLSAIWVAIPLSLLGFILGKKLQENPESAESAQ